MIPENELENLLLTRRSCRRFDQSRPIPPDAVAGIMRSQRYASSARNRQDLRYIAVSDALLAEQIFPQLYWAGLLPRELAEPKDGEHPVFYAVALENTEAKNQRADLNFGLAAANMLLTAWNLGIAGCMIGNVRRAAVSELLHIPAAQRIIAVLAFGYPLQSSRLKEVHAGESLDYRLDENGDLIVPKLSLDDAVRFI